MKLRNAFIVILIHLISLHPFSVGQLQEQDESDLFPVQGDTESNTKPEDHRSQHLKPQALDENDYSPSSTDLIEEAAYPPMSKDSKDHSATDPSMENAHQSEHSPTSPAEDKAPPPDEISNSLDSPELDKDAVPNVEISIPSETVRRSDEDRSVVSPEHHDYSSESEIASSSGSQSTIHASEQTIETVTSKKAQQRPDDDSSSNPSETAKSAETIVELQSLAATEATQPQESQSVPIAENQTRESSADETESPEPPVTANESADSDGSTLTSANETQDFASVENTESNQPTPPITDAKTKNDTYVQPVCGVWGRRQSRPPVNLKVLYLLFENVELGEPPRPPIPSAGDMAGKITDDAFAQARQGGGGTGPPSNETETETKTKSANSEFVDGLDDIGKFFEDVDPPDELDVGAVGSSIQEVLMGQGTRIILKRLRMGYMFVLKYCALAKAKAAELLLDEDGNLAFVDQESFEKAGRWIWKSSKRLFREAQKFVDNLIERGIAGGLSADDDEYGSSSSAQESNADVRELLRQYSRGTPKKY